MTTATKKMTFLEKLLEMQKRIEPIAKDSLNPHYKSKYFDINSLLAVVKPHLNDLGLVLTQNLGVLDGRQVLETQVRDVDGEGESKATAILPDNLDVQKMGAAITYFRRYAIQSLLALEAEDDDGNSTRTETSEPQQKAANLEQIATDENGKQYFEGVCYVGEPHKFKTTYRYAKTCFAHKGMQPAAQEEPDPMADKAEIPF